MQKSDAQSFVDKGTSETHADTKLLRNIQQMMPISVIWINKVQSPRVTQIHKFLLRKLKYFSPDIDILERNTK